MQKFNYIDHYKKDAEEFDYFEDRIGATEDDERRVHQFILSRINKSAGSVLDVGSGSAWVAAHFNNSDIHVVSLDISDKNVKQAREIVNNSHHTPIVGDSFNLPFIDSKFDIVIASEVIEHVFDPENFVKELLRVVKPTGKLIITTPYKEKLRYYLCVHCNQKTPVHAHIHSFDEKKLISYSNQKSNWITFGNKFLIFLRTYVILKYLPFSLWKIIDRIFNRIAKMPVHILVEYYKKT